MVNQPYGEENSTEQAKKAKIQCYEGNDLVIG